MMVTFENELVAKIEMKRKFCEAKREYLTENKQNKGVAFKSTIHIYQKIPDNLYLISDGNFEKGRNWQTWPLFSKNGHF